MAAHIDDRVDAGDPVFVVHRDQDHAAGYRRAVAYIRANRDRLLGVPDRPGRREKVSPVPPCTPNSPNTSATASSGTTTLPKPSPPPGPALTPRPRKRRSPSTARPTLTYTTRSSGMPVATGPGTLTLRFYC